MTKKIIISIVILLLSLCNNWVFAQNSAIEQLRKERSQIQKKLDQTTRQLKETLKSEKISMKKINVIQQGVEERKALINNYNNEIVLLDKKIDHLSNEKSSLEKELIKLKNDYVRLIQKAQANQNVYSKLLFVLSSSNFDQSVRRMRYLQEFTTFQRQQGEKIKAVQNKLTLKTDSLGTHKSSKVQAVKIKHAETVKLQKDVKREKTVLTDLQKKEKKLNSEYQKNQQQINEIDAKIERIIAEEIRKAEERRKEEARRKEEERIKKEEEEKQKALALARKEAERLKTEAKAAGKSQKEIDAQEKKSSAEIAKIENKKIEATPADNKVNYAIPTKEETLQSNLFERNRGRLPWPIDQGSISGHFGIQSHPVLSKVTINNKGTFFLSPSGTNARSVFDGTVSSVFTIPGGGSAVIVQHGNYRTVYGNLSNVYVHQGQKINTKQVIGKIYSDSETGKTELYFQIWEGKQILNPEGWITR